MESVPCYNPVVTEQQTVVWFGTKAPMGTPPSGAHEPPCGVVNANEIFEPINPVHASGNALVTPVPPHVVLA